MWTEEALEFAEQLRKGVLQIVVPFMAQPDVSAADYVQHVTNLRRRYPSLTFAPADAAAYGQGQQVFAGMAQQHAQQAAAAARMADSPIPAAAGQSLYAALDAYAAWVRSAKVGRCPFSSDER